MKDRRTDDVMLVGIRMAARGGEVEPLGRWSKIRQILPVSLMC